MAQQRVSLLGCLFVCSLVSPSACLPTGVANVTLWTTVGSTPRSSSMAEEDDEAPPLLSPPQQLVWVKDRAEEYPAYLLGPADDGDDDDEQAESGGRSRRKYYRVRPASDGSANGRKKKGGEVVLVDQSCVVPIEKLPPRRRSPTRRYSPPSPSAAASSPGSGNGSSRGRRRRRSRDCSSNNNNNESVSEGRISGASSRSCLEPSKVDDDDKDDDDDDSVEVTRVVPPPSSSSTKSGEEDGVTPSPEKRQRLSESPRSASAKATDAAAIAKDANASRDKKVPTAESSTTATACASSEDGDDCMIVSKPPARQTEGQVRDTITLTTAASSSSSSSSSTLLPNGYSFLSSAYLQNLAEITHTVTQDRRWTVGGTSMQPLFRWDYGDDLSAVSVFSRRYCPRPKRKRQRPACTCLLCRDKKLASLRQKQSDSEAEMIGAGANTANCGGPSTTSGTGAISTDAGELEQDEAEEDDNQSLYVYSRLSSSVIDPEEEEEDRSLYLYARLFYRKGPWFRLDDVYSRYYAPRNDNKMAIDSEAPVDDADNDGTSAGRHVSKENSPPRPKTDFFRPKGQNQNPKSCILDDALMERHLQSLRNLVSDIGRLLNKGLLRSFQDEEECGKTVGTTLLKQPERTCLLSKLGAKQKKSAQSGSSRSNSSSQQPANEIWRQMSSQTSLFGKNSLLPVRSHVDDILLDKLSEAIVMACSRIEYIRAADMRQYLRRIKSAIIDEAGKLLGRGPLTCFRLREEPTLALKRCVRLYLCATSGPGEMRGDGTNGWTSLKELDSDASKLPLSGLVRPPGIRAFNQIQYPPMAYRFGIRSSHFLDSFDHLPLSDERICANRLVEEQVFSTIESFRAWELCVELRANVDYLIELGESIRYNDRRRKRGLNPLGGRSVDTEVSSASVDFLQLLTPKGRDRVLDELLKGFDSLQNDDMQSWIRQQLDLVCNSATDEPEEILIIIAVLSTAVLSHRNKTISETECSLMRKRPWLRHLWWDGCLAYMLYDIIPVLERLDLYTVAISALETLLFGSVSTTRQNSIHPTELAPLLLSRRARGKAFDRLIIDSSHSNRKARAASASVDEGQGKNLPETCSRDIIRLCKSVINVSVGSSYVSFSAIRGLARRLKQPLSTTLDGKYCLEASELGLRLINEVVEHTAIKPSETDKAVVQKYIDWQAVTDHMVANALENEENGAGSRCAFVGFEDDGGNSRSLNVEELAMELYNTGRLPVDCLPGELKGGWVGWHDEGGNIRALFRVLCSAPLLGMDWGCGHISNDHCSTVHLSPYQGAPFDLHVGFTLSTSEDSGSDDRETSNENAHAGFYVRRRERIQEFLSKLAAMDGQDLCDLVHESIFARLQYMVQLKMPDPSLDRDLQQVRTLSLLAAGCGGKQLASIFRCFLFDYRHFSGGLPDLTLVRASVRGDYNTDAQAPEASRVLVELGAWVGEGFAREQQEAQEAQKAYAMLSDRDDEFLGCSKVGDSGGGQSRSSRRQPPSAKNSSTSRGNQASSWFPTLAEMPEKLQLVYEGRHVTTECMLVEVKSSNDRLDPRQEDWLNVLDLHGNARVCKFEDSRKRSNGGGKKKTKTEGKEGSNKDGDKQLPDESDGETS